MKNLFIYYSLTGSGDKVAEELKKQGYEIRKVKSKVKYPKSLFPLMMKGGHRALTNKKDDLEDFDTNLKGYDKIVIGSPVWDDRLAPATNALLDKLDLKGKNVSFILYSGSGQAQKATEKIQELFGKEPIILKAPKKHPQELAKLKDF
ncbi:NAD(P)H-dependent oxidoreductase [Candidatus Saccharibacteria bacterium]|nr:NAD(P)H-dependent oxidoreductase [Candidatus Saccharibacteria bacterium]